MSFVIISINIIFFVLLFLVVILFFTALIIIAIISQYSVLVHCMLKAALLNNKLQHIIHVARLAWKHGSHLCG